MFVRASKLAVIASAVAGLAVASTAHAQDLKYPVDTVTLVTHSSPGGGTDVYLREMIKYLAPAMGAEFAVENVRGGSGAKAIAKVANSPADGSVFYADQRMSRVDALKSYTLNAAFAAFEETTRGSLMAGKYADMVVLSKDILTIDEQQIPMTEVTHTIVAGQVKYRR